MKRNKKYNKRTNIENNFSLFHIALKEIHSNPKKIKRIIDNSTLTIYERKILKGYSLVRDKKNSLALREIQNLKLSNTYLNHHILLLKATCLNNTGNFKEAIENYEICTQYFNRKEDQYFKFLVYNNLLISVCNIGAIEKVEEIKFKIKSFQFTEKKFKQKQKRALLLCFINLNELKEAKNTLLKIEPNLDLLNDGDKANFFIDKFNVGLRLKDFSLMKTALNDIKRIKKYHMPENYKFMKSLYSFIFEGENLYLRDVDLKEMPILQYQYLTLKYLHQREDRLATIYWNNLSNINPDIYKEDFNFLGSECLFSISLQICLQNVSEKISIPENLSKKERLIYCSKHIRGTLSKEQIYELVFQEDYIDKESTKALSRLIHKHKHELLCNIKSIHSSYQFTEK